MVLAKVNESSSLKKWEVHVHGDIPQIFEDITAATPEAAVAAAVNQLFCRLELIAYRAETASPAKKQALPPEAKKRRK